MNPPPITGYTEDELVEQPAIVLFEQLAWEHRNCFHEFEQPGGSPLGRDSKAEVVLVSRLRPALEKLNPGLLPQAYFLAIEEITRDRSATSLAQANREIYELLKRGVQVRIPGPEGDEETVETLRVIDWEQPGNNDFFLASQFWVTGEMYTRRADLVGFVNGLPLVLYELKATHKRLETAYKNNLRDYKDAIPHLFWFNAMIVLSNGSRSRVGSVTAEWGHFSAWRKINSEGEEGIISLDTTILATCAPERLLDLVENYTVFMESRGGLIKLVAKNHQYLGVESALEAHEEIQTREGRLGVFWHTQGSGKSVSMIFFAQKVLRKRPGNWTFVVVTDRIELDDQIYKNFASAGVITEQQAQAESSAHLRRLLTEDHRYVFTLIHKFRTERGEEHPVLSERDDIIVITDEAHRSQYDTLAMNMRTALPRASFLAFTGTPLIVGEERTREVFGDYVSIYNFKQSMDDGATVPLYYENRIPELQLTNENLNEDMERLLEEAELDEEQEKKLEREFSREYHLITREDRLETVAGDLVEHLLGRGFQGKAMVVSIDKATAVKMYDRVQEFWGFEMDRVRGELAIAPETERAGLEERLRYMEDSDMAVVVSQGQNEVAEMKRKGVDIVPHRKRMVAEDLDTKFKDPDDPFRVVFVCAMWMTGFDVPSCSTIYLDKPMRNHTLMQTIARANRVFPEKNNGLIVDYVGVFRNLQRALAVYGSGSGGGVKPGDRPVRDKSALVEELQQAIGEVEGFCREREIDLVAIQKAEGFERIKLLDDAVDRLLKAEEDKKRYLTLATNVGALYKAILPDPAANQLAPACILIEVLARKIRSLIPPVDIYDVMSEVEELLDESVAAEAYIIRDREDELVDLSQIDFEALRKEFERGKKHIEAEKLKGAVRRKLVKLVRLNRSRIDFLEKFQQMIDAYNAGSLNIEELFQRLTEFAQELTAEEKRGIRQEMTEEELALFDLLTKPDMELSKQEKQQVKKAARDLLEILKREKLVLDWRKRQQSRAQVKVSIEEALDRGLPTAYTPEIYQRKCDAVYQHVFESYYGAGQSVYAAAG